MRIGERVKEYILAEYLPDTDPGDLTYETPLIKSGILDSLATLNVRSFVEDEFEVRLENHEVDFDNFGTLGDIESLVEAKIELDELEDEPAVAID